MQYRVISADNHILEPPNLFIDRVPARYRDQAPRIVRGKDGGDGWSLDGSIPDSTVGLPHGLGSVNPGARIRIAPRGLRWDELVPGNYDGAAHIQDMASDGIDAAIVYPQMVYRAYTGLADRDLGLECLKAFNDWLLEDFCSVDPRRLIGMRNVFVTGLDDVEGFRQARLGSDLVARGAMFSIDYPHEISLFGSTQQVLAELTHGLDDAVKHRLLAGNAMRVYGLSDDPSVPGSDAREAVSVS